VEVAAQLAVRLLPSAIGRGVRGQPGGKAKAVQQPVRLQRVEIRLVDLRLLLAYPVQQTHLRHRKRCQPRIPIPWIQRPDQVARVPRTRAIQHSPGAAAKRKASGHGRHSRQNTAAAGIELRFHWPFSAAQARFVNGCGSVRSLPSCRLSDKHCSTSLIWQPERGSKKPPARRLFGGIVADLPAYFGTKRKMMTKVYSASDSMNARPRIRKRKIPGRAPGLRASASAEEAAALPWPIPQRPDAIAMPSPAASGTH